jgi:hypothetical protein
MRALVCTIWTLCFNHVDKGSLGVQKWQAMTYRGFKSQRVRTGVPLCFLVALVLVPGFSTCCCNTCAKHHTLPPAQHAVS